MIYFQAKIWLPNKVSKQVLVKMGHLYVLQPLTGTLSDLIKSTRLRQDAIILLSLGRVLGLTDARLFATWKAFRKLSGWRLSTLPLPRQDLMTLTTNTMDGHSHNQVKCSQIRMASEATLLTMFRWAPTSLNNSSMSETSTLLKLLGIQCLYFGTQKPRLSWTMRVLRSSRYWTQLLTSSQKTQSLTSHLNLWLRRWKQSIAGLTKVSTMESTNVASLSIRRHMTQQSKIYSITWIALKSCSVKSHLWQETNWHCLTWKFGRP